MKTLKEVLNSKKPIIYCDLDGVLADFAKQVRTVFGPDKKTEDVLPFSNFPSDWFANLPKMADADVLVKHLRKYGYEILTGIPCKKSMPNAEADKIQWMKKHYGLSADKIHAVFTSLKKKFAVKNGIRNILIDDTQANIDAWNTAGGIGILHKNARSTIAELDKIMREEISELIVYDRNGKAKGYFSVVLSEKSQKLLAKHAIYPIVVAEHVTIAFRPDEHISRELQRKLGEKIQISCKEIMNNDVIQAVPVAMTGIKRYDSGIAHITVSHTDKAKPVDSNRMLLQPTNVEKLSLKMTGRLVFNRFK